MAKKFKHGDVIVAYDKTILIVVGDGEDRKCVGLAGNLVKGFDYCAEANADEAAQVLFNVAEILKAMKYKPL